MLLQLLLLMLFSLIQAGHGEGGRPEECELKSVLARRRVHHLPIWTKMVI
jgi:hypothetical protein